MTATRLLRLRGSVRKSIVDRVVGQYPSVRSLGSHSKSFTSVVTYDRTRTDEVRCSPRGHIPRHTTRPSIINQQFRHLSTADEPEKGEKAPEEAAPVSPDDDPVPEWQNPLHHNNPDLEKEFPEDLAPGEELEYIAAPPLEDPNSSSQVLAPPHLHELANEVVNLSMLEMNQLVNKIGDHFGFDKPPFSGSGGGGPGGAEEDEPQEEAVAKTAFDIKLTGYDDKAKIKVIKEVRGLAGLGLKEAKEMVEGAPKVIMKDIGNEEAEEIKKKLEAVGATIEIV